MIFNEAVIKILMYVYVCERGFLVCSRLFHSGAGDTAIYKQFSFCIHLIEIETLTDLIKCDITQSVVILVNCDTV